MSEQPESPPKFNILEALSKEIGKQEKKLLEAETKDDKKKDEKGRKQIKSGPKDADKDTENGDDLTDADEDETPETEPSPEEVIRGLAALRGRLEDELLIGRGGVVNTIGRIVDEYVAESRDKGWKLAGKVVLYTALLVLGYLIGNAVLYHAIYHTLPSWINLNP